MPSSSQRFSWCNANTTIHIIVWVDSDHFPLTAYLNSTADTNYSNITFACQQSSYEIKNTKQYTLCINRNLDRVSKETTHCHWLLFTRSCGDRIRCKIIYNHMCYIQHVFIIQRVPAFCLTHGLGYILNPHACIK